MHDQVQRRLTVLKQEFEKGQSELQHVERQQTYLREMLLRISGAIQVLEELLAADQPPLSANGTGPAEAPVHTGQTASTQR